MATRGSDEERASGAQPPSAADFADEPRTVLDDTVLAAGAPRAAHDDAQLAGGRPSQTLLASSPPAPRPDSLSDVTADRTAELTAADALPMFDSVRDVPKTRMAPLAAVRPPIVPPAAAPMPARMRAATPPAPVPAVGAFPPAVPAFPPPVAAFPPPVAPAPPLEPTQDLGETEAVYNPALPFGSAASPGGAGLVDPVHQLPTQQLGGPGRAARSMSSTASPVEAMKLDELSRTRVFLKVVVALTIGGIIVALSTSGDHVAKVVVLIGSVGAALGSLFLLAVLRDPESYLPRKLVLPVMPIVFGSMSGVYYWGVGSPVAAMLVYGIYFFSLGADRALTTAMYSLVAVVHAVLGIGIMTGVLVDHGVVQIDGLRTREQLAILCIIEVLYFVAYYTARVSQRVTLDAMEKLEQAVRGNAQRDALLAEARAELDRALKVGGPGRFTDQTIGSFRLGVLIGRGGMGEVYEAHGVADRREAAVKLLHPGALADSPQVQRFLREAETCARLDCPHVVRVLEVGTTAGELPFLAMERLRGHDLAHQLRRQRRLPLPQVKLLIDQLAIGLEAARVAGIVHRDLKPHNVFFAEEGGLRRWKILDFGVAKAGGSGTLTQGHVVGTPAYMAPEQARGEDVDHRADVYSLAAIIYRAATGHPVFTGKDVPTTLYEVVYRVPTQPSTLAQVAADIDRVLAIGLAKDPRDRFAFALELARWFSAAVAQGLDAEQRRRADELIARYPWGARLGGG